MDNMKEILMKKIFDNDDVQLMIEQVNKYKTVRECLFTHLKTSSAADRGAIKAVLEEGYYERFDCYDSDVCEQFIQAFIEVHKEMDVHPYIDFIVGEKLTYINKDFDAVVKEIPCVVKAVFKDHMMITDLTTNTDLWIEEGLNMDCIKKQGGN